MAAASVLVGTSEAVAPVESLSALAERFDLSRISRAPARFDPDELDGLTARTLHQLPHAAIAHRLENAGIGGGADFWMAVRGNLSRFTDAMEWWDLSASPGPASSIR